jgi:hypothetical protein
MLCAEQRDVGADFPVIAVPREKVVYAGARVRKEYLMDECDGRGGALDVQQNGADAGGDQLRNGI